MSALPPGSTIGILGGGQLGRMLASAAAELGFDVAIYANEQDSPASRVAARTIVADYRDQTALADFAAAVDVITTEFENIPAETAAAFVAAGVRVAPNPRALAIAQDRLEEKSFFNANGIATAPFAEVNSQAELEGALAKIGAPAILKTRRMGYDGQGQARIMSPADVAGAFDKIGAKPAILEGFCKFEKEISIIAARALDGGFEAYAPCENTHKNGILDRTIAPARCSDLTLQTAREEIHRIMDALDYIGVLTIEFFLMPDGALIANEMAPRVHNSGHWTIEGAATSQFEQHVRAIAGWPLGATTQFAAVEMTNLIGADVDDWQSYALDGDAHLHLYGKREARPGRKMGHVTRLMR
ncbi:phosphoribosylaminoimidazole carboxylase ATPase subunit [alpha proteobacterium U9-1i]|nr:phosphoribosylaminoimidazole carboxylase ATPase subunit [alpha proteobacterium U9-1i]